MRILNIATLSASTWDMEGSWGSECLLTQDDLLGLGIFHIPPFDLSPLCQPGTESEFNQTPCASNLDQLYKDTSSSSSPSSTCPTPKNDPSPSHPDIKLRSASRKRKNLVRRNTMPEKEARARECHNNVEKKYRNRLTSNFEALLAVLPEAQLLAQCDQSGRQMRGRQFTRGQVLDAAIDRILTLEKEAETLTATRDRLLRDVAGMNLKTHLLGRLIVD